MKLAVSVLSVEKEEIKHIIPTLDESNLDYFHIDVMDGKFVAPTAFSYEDILDIQNYTSRALDVHLMVVDPMDYINNLKMIKPAFITIHREINNYKDCIEYLKLLHIKCGLSIKPDTSIDDIIEDLPNINMVLIMSVEPGYGGQKFMESSLDKISKLKKIINENNYDIKISVDGGINLETGEMCLDAGADILVSGSYVINNIDNGIIDEFKKL